MSPPGLQAVALHAPGIRPASTIADRRGRVHRASEGQPVVGLFGTVVRVHNSYVSRR
jgi:hypothetical protein